MKKEGCPGVTHSCLSRYLGSVTLTALLRAGGRAGMVATPDPVNPGKCYSAVAKGLENEGFLTV